MIHDTREPDHVLHDPSACAPAPGAALSCSRSQSRRPAGGPSRPFHNSLLARPARSGDAGSSPPGVCIQAGPAGQTR